MAQHFAHGNHTRTNGGRTPRDRARRALSQNFLVDRQAVELVVKAAAPDGLVLEPGSGEGVLTWALAAAGARVIGYEIDPRLAGRLAARTRDDPRIDVVRADFTTARAPRGPFAVVGNIPYSVTSAIVGWCLRAPGLTSATLLTQREYARKRSGDYGRWSLVTVESWPWFRWRLGDRVGRESFRPVPSVDSAILRIERRATPLVGAGRGYQELVELGFGGVGGSVRASLRRRYEGVDAAVAAAGIARDAVVGHVHPDQWITLWERLCR
ncbi:ErmE/ErmH/ErmO/ErmR family 23S rRNA (adenine(2058)-N(6))-methyltransferase [Nonomuraea sp. NEAU-A123]|uniref:ErmE/ErmH/ErmO/ErmR family 23S rRNA (adenine(2058)-N(6))-methyltransferase n=1 Tax=Nonomuraea sp. NEAU-A123 TaxID=2839649 RepID=UPI001BE3F3A4|nr:ErmE/ErmH/ErmO/ErmR family 23S rRNA (adenine(2058)-N(6))-methyltransferase [Nonomuraea sp. NEAU-A123]MBT2235235.1 ErmE/ErmH/ErmO/ErmR family 23S rRNA (adenine(2058)-N(6))-methyltransferase [Nonomuraea sp. NEAU-A123]